MVRSIVAFGFLSLFAMLAVVLIGAASHPWSISWGESPALTGAWSGELRTATGRTWSVLIEIEPPGRGCGNCPDISATARVCVDKREIHEYKAWGDGNWRGSRFELTTTPAGNLNYELQLGSLEGEWNADILNIRATLRAGHDKSTIRVEKDEAGKETTTILGAHPDTRAPVAFTLRKGTERAFLLACR